MNKKDLKDTDAVTLDDYGINPEAVKVLKKAGYLSPAAVRVASDRELDRLLGNVQVDMLRAAFGRVEQRQILSEAGLIGKTVVNVRWTPLGDKMIQLFAGGDYAVFYIEHGWERDGDEIHLDSTEMPLSKLLRDYQFDNMGADEC